MSTALKARVKHSNLVEGGGGGFIKEMKDDKGPLFDLTAAFQQTTEFVRSKENELLLMSFMLACLRTHSPIFYYVVDRVRVPTVAHKGHDANKTTAAK